MDRRFTDIAGRCITLFFLSLIVTASFVSCTKDEPATKSSSSASSPYSSDSVFGELKKKLQDNPNDVDALYHLADLYERNAQYNEAVDTYKKVIKLKPDMGYAYFKMGTAYSRLGKAEEAVPVFKKAAKLMPDNPVLYNNMGVAYGKLGKLDDEIAALKKALKLRPSYSSATYNLGIAYLKKKNKKAAMQQYESLKKFDEGAAEALLKEIKKAS